MRCSVLSIMSYSFFYSPTLLLFSVITKKIQRLWNNHSFVFFFIDYYDHFAWLQRIFSVMTKKIQRLWKTTVSFFHWLLRSLCLASACLVLCVVLQYCAKAGASCCYSKRFYPTIKYSSFRKIVLYFPVFEN